VLAVRYYRRALRRRRVYHLLEGRSGAGDAEKAVEKISEG
jgi:hypothetical protein